MSSNEHPDMSGNPCDDPIVCDHCGRDCNESDLYGSLFDDNKNFCRSQCVHDWEEHEGWEMPDAAKQAFVENEMLRAAIRRVMAMQMSHEDEFSQVCINILRAALLGEYKEQNVEHLDF
jgi:hypothetical protein